MGTQILIAEDAMIKAGAIRLADEFVTIPGCQDCCDSTCGCCSGPMVFGVAVWSIPGIFNKARSYNGVDFCIDFGYNGSNRAKLLPWIEEHSIPYKLF